MVDMKPTKTIEMILESDTGVNPDSLANCIICQLSVYQYYGQVLIHRGDRYHEAGFGLTHYFDSAYTGSSAVIHYESLIPARLRALQRGTISWDVSNSRFGCTIFDA